MSWEDFHLKSKQELAEIAKTALAPRINGKPATWDNDIEESPMDEALTYWRCPECNSRLPHPNPYYICVNACHLTAAQLRRFQSQMRAISVRLERGDHLKDE